MKKIKLIAIAALSLTVFACKTGTDNKTSDKGNKTEVSKQVDTKVEGWKTLGDTDFSIQYPEENYTLQQPGQMGTKFMLINKRTASNGQFQSNINLTIQPIPAGQAFDEKAIEVTLNQVKSMITGFNLIDKGSTEINGQKFYKIIYTGKMGTFDLKWEQIFVEKNNKMFILTFTSIGDKFDSFVAEAEKIMYTLKAK